MEKQQILSMQLSQLINSKIDQKQINTLVNFNCLSQFIILSQSMFQKKFNHQPNQSELQRERNANHLNISQILEDSEWSAHEIAKFENLFIHKQVDLTELCPLFPNKCYNQILLLAKRIESVIEDHKKSQTSVDRENEKNENLQVQKPNFSTPKQTKCMTKPLMKKPEPKSDKMEEQERQILLKKSSEKNEEQDEIKRKEEEEQIDVLPAKNHGRWSESEHRIFLKYYDRSRLNNEEVACHIKTRSPGQVRSHAQKYYNKREKSQEKKEIIQQGLKAIKQTGGKALTRNQRMQTKIANEEEDITEIKYKEAPHSHQIMRDEKKKKNIIIEPLSLQHEIKNKKKIMEEKRKRKESEEKIEAFNVQNLLASPRKERKKKVVFSPDACEVKKNPQKVSVQAKKPIEENTCVVKNLQFNRIPEIPREYTRDNLLKDNILNMDLVEDVVREVNHTYRKEKAKIEQDKWRNRKQKGEDDEKRKSSHKKE